MSNLKTRLENLEQKLMIDDTNQPNCIIIIAESGRLDAKPDESPIVRLTSNSETYDREPQELEDNFVLRVAQAAKDKLPLPDSVPTLIAWTEKMLAD